LVSVIIPTYNRSKLLKECLNSILKQTYDDFEILIIDDGSTDDTEQIVVNLDKRVNYHRLQKTGNISTLRNYGVRHSRGEHIAFCDDDDIWHPQKLEIQLAYIENFDIMCTNADLINLEGQSKDEKYCNDFRDNVILDTVHLFLKNYVITSTVLLKKAILPSIPFDYIRYKSTAEEYDLWFKLSLNNPILFINESLVKYRIHSNLTYNSENYPIICINSIDILNKYKRKVPPKYKKYADWGILKFRKEYIKLNFYQHKNLLMLKELMKVIPIFFKVDFLYLLINKIIHPRRNILQNIENPRK
jgi:glycosyltransferase involved in cell wall biosynthesis